MHFIRCLPFSPRQRCASSFFLFPSTKGSLGRNLALELDCIASGRKVQEEIGSSFVSSCARRNGLSIGPLPSTGLMTTRSVPRTTTRPRDLVVLFPSSSMVHTGGGLVWVAYRSSTLCSCVCLFICGAGEGGRVSPPSCSCTSSRTRFMRASYPLRMPVTIDAQVTPVS